MFFMVSRRGPLPRVWWESGSKTKTRQSCVLSSSKGAEWGLQGDLKIVAFCKAKSITKLPRKSKLCLPRGGQKRAKMRPCKIKNLMRFQSWLFYIGFAIYSVMRVMHEFSKCNPSSISFVAHSLACAERNENRKSQPADTFGQELH